MNLTLEALYIIIGIVVTFVGLVVGALKILDRRIAPLLTSILEITVAVKELRVTLIGIDGQNGIRSTVKTLEHDVKNIRQVIDRPSRYDDDRN